MRINSINTNSNFYKNQLQFLRKLKSHAEISKEYEAIENAISQIAANSDYIPSITQISEITGLSYTVISSRINSVSARGESLKNRWNALKELRASESGQAGISVSKEDAKEYDYKKIISAIKEIAENDEYRLTQRQISQLTGIPYATVSSRLYAKNKHAKEIEILWDKTKAIKLTRPKPKRINGKTDSNIDRDFAPSVKAQQHKEEMLLRIKSKNDATKQKHLRKAVRLINEALISGRKISYKEFETQCNLSKEEVDKLVQQYAQYKQKQSQLAQDLKQQQAQWYKDNKENKN